MSHLDTPVVAVVVAAGSGSRLGAAQPKALVELEGVTLVRRSVDALAAGGVEQVVVTVPHGLEPEFRTALDGAAVPTTCVEGGSTRQDSVRIGLAAITAPDRAVVLVHDAARALIPPTVVRAVASAVAGGAEVAIPVLPVVDSIRRIDGASSQVVDRAPLRAVQTPQGARFGALRRAHDLLLAEALEVTDDAAACEHAGLSVTLVDGHRDALKITEPVDLVLARAILAARDHSH
ncbi:MULTISPECIES: 2-C-methyl-D-erythritol 4-phosphate cytidylyltransferase [unclassified Tessaracoccus]|uniref:2-C-methyl-D-erythritol 4-phosphate cytidylyltransferase n=1 Tax=unclassified Tessaracoccus TaxID=2635419 RepID=UPI001C7189FA